jgi:hypothetical protein
MVPSRPCLIVAVNTQAWFPQNMHEVHVLLSVCMSAVAKYPSTSLYELILECFVPVMQQVKGLQEHTVSSRHTVFVLVLLVTSVHQPDLALPAFL